MNPSAVSWLKMALRLRPLIIDCPRHLPGYRRTPSVPTRMKQSFIQHPRPTHGVTDTHSCLDDPAVRRSKSHLDEPPDVRFGLAIQVIAAASNTSKLRGRSTRCGFFMRPFARSEGASDTPAPRTPPHAAFRPDEAASRKRKPPTNGRGHGPTSRQQGSSTILPRPASSQAATCRRSLSTRRGTGEERCRASHCENAALTSTDPQSVLD